MTNALVSLAFVASALYVASIGRGRIAGLMALVGVTWWLGDVVPAAALLHRGPLAHLLLGYPDGRLERRYERATVAAVYVTGAWVDVGGMPLVTLATAVAVLACALARALSATGMARRARTVPAVAAAALAAVLAAGAVGRMLDGGVDGLVLHAYEVALIAVAVGFAIDLRFGDWHGAAVTGLVIDLGREADDTLGARLGRVLGDPAAVVAFPLERGGYVDEHGRAIAVADVAPDRVATTIEGDGRELAVVIHDSALLAAPRLLDGIAGALTMALANARLESEVRSRVAAVAASRERLMTAAEAERRRFSERLRGSLEPRLEAAAQALVRGGDAGEPLAGDLDGVRADIRALAEGLLPAAFADGGLEGALGALAARSAIPVELQAVPAGLARPIEREAWFVCSEALANAVKHSRASRARVRVMEIGGVVRIEITDDGRGGADPARGSGLRGLAERVEALGGRMSVADRPGGGTVLSAELPAR